MTEETNELMNNDNTITEAPPVPEATTEVVQPEVQPETPEIPTVAIDPALYAQIKADLMKDLLSNEEKKKQAMREAREEEKQARAEYVDLMKSSSEPWVDIIGWVETNQGIRVELDWNQSFVTMLVDAGYVGRSDEMIVQQWITILLRDMADRMEDKHLDEQDDI